MVRTRPVEGLCWSTTKQCGESVAPPPGTVGCESAGSSWPGRSQDRRPAAEPGLGEPSGRRSSPAYRQGLALALPDAVMARPTGFGSALTAYDMPIEGRDEWLAAAARHLA